MKQRPKQPPPGKSPTLFASDADQIVQIKVWLLGISPTVWRRVLVPAAYTVRALHGVIQVVMGWEGIHLYQFRLRAARYGSWELSASSPEMTLAALQLRKGTRFIYEYDLNVPWRHEVRIEDRLSPAPPPDSFAVALAAVAKAMERGARTHIDAWRSYPVGYHLEHARHHLELLAAGRYLRTAP
jgi:Plasmid pRiA4b ORF-3-like protein